MSRCKWIILILIISATASLIFIVAIFYNNREPERRMTVATVNGVPIYQDEIEKALKLYQNSPLTYEDVLTSAIREELVVQEAGKMGFAISDNELNEKIKDYERSFPRIYEELLSQYGSFEGFKQSYLYLLRYNFAKEKIKKEFEESSQQKCSFQDYFEEWIDSLQKGATITYHQ